MTQVGTSPRTLFAALAVWFAFHSACSDDAAREGDSGADVCPFEIDELLAEVGQSIPGRKSCGAFNSASAEEIVASLDCLLGETGSAQASTELRVTRCSDCMIESTYIVSSQGDIFHVFREADHYGDDQREVAVERCADIVEDDVEAVRCVDPEPLFDCQDLLPREG